MNGFRKLTPLNLVIILFFIVSCDSSTSPPAFQNGGIGQNSPGPACKAMVSNSILSELKSELEYVRRESEAHLHKMSDQFPDFGGVYIDDNGTYTILLTDLEGKKTVKTAFSVEGFAKTRSGSVALDVNIRKAEHRFRDLAMWRELATAFLLAGNQFHYVLSTQVHEAENRVAIGIDAAYWSGEVLDEVTEFLIHTLEVPQNALLFEKEYAEIDEDANIFENLNGDTFDRQRPILGGLRIQYGSGNCSMGFLGVYDGEDIFVTNGHCTENAHGTSATLYYQGERDEPYDVVGVEIADGPQSLDMCVSPNSDCWPCRWSDSAIVRIRENVERARGYIARTEWKSETWTVEGSREIDEADPVFAVIDLKEDILMGMTLHKVGGNSGWTSGEVIRTCVDSRRTRHEMILQCQFRARYATSGGGTSGSPVFKRVAFDIDGIQNPVALVGIHRASSNRDQANGYSAFSPINGVLKDFEELEGLTIETESDINE